MMTRSLDDRRGLASLVMEEARLIVDGAVGSCLSSAKDGVRSRTLGASGMLLRRVAEVSGCVSTFCGLSRAGRRRGLEQRLDAVARVRRRGRGLQPRDGLELARDGLLLGCRRPRTCRAGCRPSRASAWSPPWPRRARRARCPRSAVAEAHRRLPHRSGRLRHDLVGDLAAGGGGHLLGVERGRRRRRPLGARRRDLGRGRRAGAALLRRRDRRRCVRRAR